MTYNKDKYRITTSKDVIDYRFVIASLQSTYWAENRSDEIIRKSFEDALTFSLMFDDRQIGMARIIGDGNTFAWLCDVYIDPEYRGIGLGKWLVECCLEHPAANVRLCILATKDAHGLYDRYGFETKEIMIRRLPEA